VFENAPLPGVPLAKTMRILVQFFWVVGVFLAALRVLVVVGPPVQRRLGRLVRRWRAKRAAPALGLTLRVGVDEAGGRIMPSVLFRGEPLRRPGRVRLELVDEFGQVRFTCAREFPPDAVGREWAMPSFLPPDGVHQVDVLGWRWDVVLETPGRRPARWNEYLLSADRFDAEAQIAAPI
jgi:hypothetical protein